MLIIIKIAIKKKIIKINIQNVIFFEKYNKKIVGIYLNINTLKILNILKIKLSLKKT